MALWSTPCEGKRHGVGKGGERGRERSGEQKGVADGNGNGQGTEKREAGGSKEDNGDRNRKASVGGERGGVPGDLRGKGC